MAAVHMLFLLYLHFAFHEARKGKFLRVFSFMETAMDFESNTEMSKEEDTLRVRMTFSEYLSDQTTCMHVYVSHLQNRSFASFN